MERIYDYINKAEILRQIHSDKANKYRYYNTVQNIITIAVSSLITFIGFYGLDKLSILLNMQTSLDKSILEIAFNISVFILFVNVIFHLVFQYSKKEANENRAIVLLTSFINETTDIIESSKTNSRDIVRYKYESITSTISANTDKEYFNAKKKFKEKQSIKLEISKISTDIFDESILESYTTILIKNSLLYEFLQKIRDISTELYLGGGAVRNLVWDKLHGYPMYNQFADLDIVYFDTLHNTKESDERIEQQFFGKIPNIKCSVKNQARMHIHNNEEAYGNLFEAIQKWPETCTSIAIRLNENNEIEYIKPYGFTDLYRLIVAPTPHFKHKLEKYRERVNAKQWKKTWIKLRFFDL
jgi:hypothetical protein